MLLAFLRMMATLKYLIITAAILIHAKECCSHKINVNWPTYFCIPRRVWNKLPHNIRHAPSLESFKTALKTTFPSAKSVFFSLHSIDLKEGDDTSAVVCVCVCARARALECVCAHVQAIFISCISTVCVSSNYYCTL